MDGIKQKIKEYFYLGAVILILGILLGSTYFAGYNDGKKGGIVYCESMVRQSISEGLPLVFENGGVFLLVQIKSKRISYRVMSQIEDEIIKERRTLNGFSHGDSSGELYKP